MIPKKITTDPKTTKTGLPYYWQLSDTDGTPYNWQGFYTGPLVLSTEKVAQLCQQLLNIDIGDLLEVASAELRPVPSLEYVGASIVMHSTTPDLKTFDGDLDKVMKGITPTDYTSYKEGRAVYLAGPGDMGVGRIQPWKVAADLGQLEAVELPTIDYYYLSHALLALAEQHLDSPSSAIEQIVTFLQKRKNAVVRLYALETEMQIFLIWLKRLAGLDYLLMDANSPEVARDWNRKSVLFPTVRSVQNLKIQQLAPHEILAEEAKYSFLRQQLNCHYPVLPGYTVVREGNSLAKFTKQTLTAAQLLQTRYGLTLGCFKASDSGDGARITPGVVLKDRAKLTKLAKDAYRHGDDYILEPHVQYSEIERNGEILKASPSAHIRWGEVAPGLTLQFTEGTSWKGNIYIDKKTAADFGVSEAHCTTIIKSMHDLLHAFHSHDLGLAIAGLDFAIGQIGGYFGEEVLIGVQDPNISFNGAECLRVFLEKVRKQNNIADAAPLYGATRVFKPSAACTLPTLHKITTAATQNGTYADAIAAVPERWAMVAVAHQDLNVVMEKLGKLRADLLAKGLMQ